MGNDLRLALPAHVYRRLVPKFIEPELVEIARAGYAAAASTDRKGREAAVSLFLSDAVWGLTQ